MVASTVKEILSILSVIDSKLVAECSVLKAPHSTSNEVKIDTFIKLLSKHGWKGVELVVGSRGHLLTGTHRFNALKRMEWADADIPTINIKELIGRCGFGVKHLVNKGLIKRGTLVFDELRGRIPKKMQKKYGL